MPKQDLSDENLDALLEFIQTQLDLFERLQWSMFDGHLQEDMKRWRAAGGGYRCLT